MQRDAIDFDAVAPEHARLHARLENWGRWARSGARGGLLGSPMFALYRSTNAKERNPSTRAPAPDELDGLAIERAVRALPANPREAVRWCYCFSFVSPGRLARYLGVRVSELPALVYEGRALLVAARA